MHSEKIELRKSCSTQMGYLYNLRSVIAHGTKSVPGDDHAVWVEWQRQSLKSSAAVIRGALEYISSIQKTNNNQPSIKDWHDELEFTARKNVTLPGISELGDLAPSAFLSETKLQKL